MLSYLHSFHAGNHADILKHFTLLYVLNYLNKKDKPYSFFDTHAGSGLYKLDSDESLKTGEAKDGILKLLEYSEKNPSEVPESLKNYLEFVKELLKKGFYPGSPAFEILLTKEKSYLSFSELHKKAFEQLNESMNYLKPKAYANIQNTSGWELVKKNIPPAVKRGGLICDPSYEDLTDYINASDFISLVHKKWNAALCLLWYPLLKNKAEEIDNMKQRILSSVKNQDSHTEVLDVQLLVDSEDSHLETELEEAIGSKHPRLYGSGMYIVQPSWGLKETLEEILPFLAKVLGRDGQGSWKVELL